MKTPHQTPDHTTADVLGCMTAWRRLALWLPLTFGCAMLAACAGDTAETSGISRCFAPNPTEYNGYDAIGDPLRARNALLADSVPTRPRLVWMWRSLTRTEVASAVMPLRWPNPTEPTCTLVAPPSDAMAKTFTLAVSARMKLASSFDGTMELAGFRGYTPWLLVFDDLNADDEFTAGTDRVLAWSHGTGGDYASGTFWIKGFENALRDVAVAPVLRRALPNPSTPFVFVLNGTIFTPWSPRTDSSFSDGVGCDHVFGLNECALISRGISADRYEEFFLHMPASLQDALSLETTFGPDLDRLRTYEVLGDLGTEAPDWLRNGAEASLTGTVQIGCGRTDTYALLHLHVLAPHGRFSISGEHLDAEMATAVPVNFERAVDASFEAQSITTCACDRVDLHAFALVRTDALPAWWPCDSVGYTDIAEVAAILAESDFFFSIRFVWELLGLVPADEPDAGVSDAGVSDAGVSDAGVSDAGVSDAAVP